MKLLDQYDDFDSLHWFAGAKASLSREAVSDRLAKPDEADSPTTTLTLMRLERYQTAIELLRYNLSSARIFFRWASSTPGTAAVSGGHSDSGSGKGGTAGNDVDRTPV